MKRLGRSIALISSLALVPSLALADKTYMDETSVTHDCKTEPNVKVNAGNGTFTFTGPCNKIGINGGNNTVRIERVKKLGVNSSANTVEVTTVDDIGVNGSNNKVHADVVKNVGINGTDNTVTYKSGPGGRRKPTVGKAGTGNTVTQRK